jgi:hypothetical protein
MIKFFITATIILSGLKMAKVIKWPWKIVLIPFWLPVVFAVLSWLYLFSKIIITGGNV